MYSHIPGNFMSGDSDMLCILLLSSTELLLLISDKSGKSRIVLLGLLSKDGAIAGPDSIKS